ncbi:Phenylalanine--tRNA ligase alpha subunit [Bienertia sinuspersici]
MCVFRSYVRNKSRPEGSIAESVTEKDCLIFISRCLSTTETQFNRIDRNDDIERTPSHHLSVFSIGGKPLGKASVEHLTFEEWKIAYSYVVKNCEEAQPFVDYFDFPNDEKCDDDDDPSSWDDEEIQDINEVQVGGSDNEDISLARDDVEPKKLPSSSSQSETIDTYDAQPIQSEVNVDGYSKEQARARRPPGVEQAKWNWLIDDFWSDPKQKINAPSTQSATENGDSNANVDGNANANDGKLDEEEEVNLNLLKDLHAKQIEEHGVDNLTPFEAFPKVLSECSGYNRGLGYGPKPPKRARIGADSEVRDEIQQLQQAATQQKKMKEESVEREKHLRQELMAEFMAMIKSSKGVM